MRKTLLRVTATLAMTVGALAGLSLAWSAPAQAETFPVETTADSGNGSLRWAVGEANETEEADTILFALEAGATITLSQTLTVTEALTIQGPGAQALTISGNSAVRPFSVAQTSMTLSGVTVLNGRAVDTSGVFDRPNNYGGAIFNVGGTLTIRDSILRNNYALYKGGAVHNLDGKVSVIDSTLSGNDTGFFAGAIYNDRFIGRCLVSVTGSTLTDNSSGSQGGALYNRAGCETDITGGSRLDGNQAPNGGGVFNAGTVRVTDSDISGNSALVAGAGAYNTGDAVVRRSTFSGNEAADYGGGLSAASGTLEVGESTFHGNTVDQTQSYGGGIAIRGGRTTVTNTTLSANRAHTGGGIAANAAATAPTIRGSIVAGNSAPSGTPDVEGNYTDGGFNIVGGTAVAAGLRTDSGGSPVLAANGGPTKTVALVRGGEAIDAGNSFDSTTDQRGTPRPKDYASLDNAQGGDGSDVGAFEYVDPDASAPTVEATATPPPDGSGPNNSDVTVSISASDEAGGSGVWRTSYSAGGAQQVTEENVTGDSAELKISADGETTVTYWATDRAGNRSESRTITVRVDSAAPTVARATPTGMKVPPKSDVAATFSEGMDEASVAAQGAFTLKKKGATKAVSATVSYDPDTRKATLDPARKLTSGATYVARVSTTATDPAGNALDQDSSTAGNQPKTWRFQVR